MSTKQSIYTGNYGGSKTQLNDFISNYESWLGKDLWGISIHTGDDNWLDWSGSLNWLSNLYSDANHDHQILWSIHLIPETEATMQDAAIGNYNDKYVEAAQKLLNASDAEGTEPIYIRTGWEFNFEWARVQATAGGQEADYVGAYQQFVESFRSVSDRFLFEWTPNIGTDGSTDIEAAYPGDEYVDIIGMDFYWDSQGKWSIKDPVEAWDYMLNQPYGLNWLSDFAEQQGKPIAISEWGLNSDNAAPYIEAAMQWFEDNNVLYQNYWESNSAFDGMISEGQYPISADVFLDAFGAPLEQGTVQEIPEDLPDIPSMPVESAANTKWIVGSSASETVHGTDFNDIVIGNGGTDTLVGGLGDDHYQHAIGKETIIELAGEGIDKVSSWAVDNTLSINVEHLYLLGNGYVQNGTGNALNNIISGTVGNNQLTGMKGDDWIVTGEGKDIIHFNKGDGHDVVTDFSIENDRLYLNGYDFNYYSLLDSLYQQGEHTTLYLDNSNAITFLDTLKSDFSFSNFYYKFEPYTPEALEASSSNQTWISGSSASETLNGTALNDAIASGGGNDVLSGGLGDDHYKHMQGRENIVELDSEGIDSVYSWASSTYLSDNVEHLYLLGSYKQNGTGNELDNIIKAKNGHNIIRGNEGIDWITTGGGNDTIIFAKGDGHDVITDFDVTKDVVEFEGFDPVTADISDLLFADGENTIFYIDADNAMTFLGISAEQLSYYNFNFPFISTSDSDGSTESLPGDFELPVKPDELIKSLSNQTWISGTSASENLSGTDKHDAIASGGGQDMLVGGLGDDHYKHMQGKETIIELDGEGIDSVYSWAASTDLSDNVENLYLLGSGYKQNGAGNELDNIIKAKSGNNILRGGKGDDWITTGGGHDEVIFVKGDGHDVITDFDVNKDVLNIDGFNPDTTFMMNYLYTQGDDVVLYLGEESIITFENMSVSDFGFKNFSLSYIPPVYDELTNDAGADVFTFGEEAFNQNYFIEGLSVSDGDQIDISDLLEAYDPLQNALSDFVEITTNSENVKTLKVDIDGGEALHQFEQVLSFTSDDVSTLEDLVNSNALL